MYGRQDASKTGEYWAGRYADQTFARREWIGHPKAQERARRITGGHHTLAQWFEATQMLRRPVKRGLGIGVGSAWQENQLVLSGAVERFDYYDVSQGGLDLAKKSATDLGIAGRIRFLCADVNEVALPPDAYDVITCMASLHHIHELEATLRACRRALAHGGVFWANEYVGPDRFQFPDEHASLARTVYRLLERDMRYPGEPELKFPSAEAVIAVDPSESVCSSQIVPALKRVWPDVKIHGQYGSLLFMLMWCLNHDALYDTEEGFRAFGDLVELETDLVDRGALPHYFVNAIARKPA